eukprot:10326399-Ditylum_brightwellii.AAC.1
MSDTVSKYLEDWGEIWENAQVKWDLHPVAEEAPLVPVGGLGVRIAKVFAWGSTCQKEKEGQWAQGESDRRRSQPVCFGQQ